MTEQGDRLINGSAEPDGATAPDVPAAEEQPPDQEANWRARLERVVAIEELAESLRKERDEYLDLARRAQADLANYRKRVARQQSEQVERAGEALLVRLLPLVDALEAAAGQHPRTVAPLQAVLHALLEAEGVERLAPAGEPFDPAVAEAVEHEGEGDRQVVAEVCRPGFRWKGRLLRPASVKVRSEPSEVASAPTEAAAVENPGKQADQG